MMGCTNEQHVWAGSLRDGEHCRCGVMTVCGRDLNRSVVEHGTRSWAVKTDVTERGFGRAMFYDSYGQEVSIQESSVMPNLWLGIGSCRMHLTPEQARGLAHVLLDFSADHDLAALFSDNPPHPTAEPGPTGGEG